MPHQELGGQITGPYKTRVRVAEVMFERGTKGGDADPPKKTLQLRFEHGPEAPLMQPCSRDFRPLCYDMW